MNPESSLRPAYCIDSDAKPIVRKASELTASIGSARDKVRLIFGFVRDEIPYNFAPAVSNRSHFRASHTLELGTGFCMQKAALFAALCRASGVPARIGFQDIRDYMIVGDFLHLMGTNELSPHGMNAVFLNGRRLMADCTLDRGWVNRKRYRL
ncbi:MAG: transglutaminase domain-containing protein, partial [Proteobacteria bacterium]|nr:transglutaminase domain-containing protein [Pseudomonadota bacterium]